MADKIKNKIRATLSCEELKEAMDKWSKEYLVEYTKMLPTMSYDEAFFTANYLSGVFEQASEKWDALESFDWKEDVRKKKEQ